MTTTPTRGRLPVARRDRRPALAALAVLLILLGALGSALIALRSGDRVDVLVANRDIRYGQVVTASDFTQVRAAADSEGSYIGANFLNNFVGTRATGNIPQGTIVNQRMFFQGSGVPADGQLVGMVIDSAQRPSAVPRAGQVVRIYRVSDDPAVDAEVVIEAARVVSVGPGDGAGSNNITVLLDLAGSRATQVANLSAAGALAVTILADDTQPSPDMQGSLPAPAEE